ncbi:hypothetical protein PG991_016122 [Apiospora marii]|uniref:Heterokaryon incompatibility domain-containing protein n=1 Tax=Apiospora marii TaxID=335849 RepID=A0ABR1R0L5_9PEZI
MNSYSYPDTPLHDGEIRYLTVHAFDDSVGVVQCSLHRGSLHDLDGQFTALSYAWGDANVTEAIRLSGHLFNVTTNLAACLRQLAISTKYQEIRLWVDAICINQRDVNERNSQVQRMGDIYSLARSVVAWLGPGTGLSHLAMQRLQKINPHEIGTLKNSKETNEVDRRKEIFDEIFENDGEGGLRDLLSRPYWGRTWIVQEIRRGREVRLVCGTDEVTLGKMAAFIELSKFFLFSTFTNEARSSRTIALLDYTDESGSYNILDSTDYPPEMIYYLQGFRGHRCSDPRDKVYALLGITTGLDVEKIVPDYDRPIAKVYRNVVETHIRSHDDLKFLDYTGYTKTGDPVLASWIPDWRTPATGIFGLYRGPYYASKRLALSSHPWSLDRQTEKLHLTGACLDTITTLSDLFNFGSPDRSTSERVTRITVECLQLVYQTLTQRPFTAESFTGFSKGPDEPRYSLDDSEPLADACRRTLVLDLDRVYATRLGCASAGYPFMFLLPGEDEQQRSDGSNYTHADTLIICAASVNHRRLAITSKGWIGLVPGEAEVGDYVSVLVGASMPVILRKAPVDDLRGREDEDMETGSTGDEFLVVGYSYIHGLMHGKGLDLGELGNITLR